MSPSLKQFTRLKFDWLEQVASDDGLPPQAPRIAILLASRYLNKDTLLANPSYETIADDLRIEENTAIATVRALINRGHMVIAIPGRKGRGHSNHYRPIISENKTLNPARVFQRQNPKSSEGFKETENPQFDLLKTLNGEGMNPIEPYPPTPFPAEPSAEGAQIAEPRAEEPGADRLAQDAAEFLAAMPHRPSHVATPSKGFLRAYAEARAEGATRDDILAGAHRCKAYHAAKHGNGVCDYAPSPDSFLRERKWMASWKLPTKRRRVIDPDDREEAREALRREIRGNGRGP
jgi:hypothetical protein